MEPTRKVKPQAGEGHKRDQQEEDPIRVRGLKARTMEKITKKHSCDPAAEEEAEAEQLDARGDVAPISVISVEGPPFCDSLSGRCLTQS